MTFSERHVEADGVRIRYLEAGQGVPLVHLQGALRLTPAHDLLSRHFRVLAVEIPRPDSPPGVMVRAIARVGLDTFNLMATSIAGGTALRLALEAPARIPALVLETPAGNLDAELESRLPGLATPTLVLCGTRDRGDARAVGRRYKALLPGCHLVFVYEAADAISADRPQAFAEVVGDFLERHEAFVISRTETVIHP